MVQIYFGILLWALLQKPQEIFSWTIKNYSFAVQDKINCYKNRILFEENWRLKIKQSEGEMRFNLTRADINNNSETRRQFSRLSQNQILSKKVTKMCKTMRWVSIEPFLLPFCFWISKILTEFLLWNSTQPRQRGRVMNASECSVKIFHLFLTKASSKTFANHSYALATLRQNFLFLSVFLSKILPGKKSEADKMTKLYP